MVFALLLTWETTKWVIAALVVFVHQPQTVVIGSANPILLPRVKIVILLSTVVTVVLTSFVTTTFVPKQQQQLQLHLPHRNALQRMLNVLGLPLLEEFAVLAKQNAQNLLMIPTILKGLCVQPRFPKEEIFSWNSIFYC